MQAPVPSTGMPAQPPGPVQHLGIGALVGRTIAAAVIAFVVAIALSAIAIVLVGRQVRETADSGSDTEVSGLGLLVIAVFIFLVVGAISRWIPAPQRLWPRILSVLAGPILIVLPMLVVGLF